METDNPGSAPAIKKLKILLAEDDKINQKLFSYMLNDIADELLIASTGVEAINLYEEHSDIDLILMDLKMPEMDGFEAVKNIRKLDKVVKIFALSAFAPETQSEIVNGNDFNDYVSKPIRKADLLKIIGEYF
ncbi:CheY chemotaxis protein or a CheY-like REC (receiver) domain [Draconibacterium orientale]|uniref:CheY chemotaxis protein or a CheY-like REC (Receiver) domain n=1 Tax=Draconibacterium orientale TaxID=1168034 RepID=X5DAN5_9BACT|nr:response regulator [Draconibacterium orientale]AHW59838.1 response regulator receiver protein [Draconibacterium orientale]SET18898.1 CheY chemotaxis protein or a CheY-like REC (receiver) domain [Draconibacterium orientale]